MQFVVIGICSVIVVVGLAYEILDLRVRVSMLEDKLARILEK